MKLLRLFLFSAGLMWSLGAQTELINVQEAIEASDIRVTMQGEGAGHVLARSCERCPFKRLAITPATIISVGEEQVPAGKSIKRHWSGGLVIYDPETMEVVRLKL